MQRSIAKSVSQRILPYGGHIPTTKSQTCDVFINHRRVDTNKNVSGLLYHQLLRYGVKPFLDSQTMKPGDQLLNTIDAAIRGCKVGVAVFSPHYCESYYCLHELSLMMESRKKVVPIFVDVKPSELRVLENAKYPMKDIKRFSLALEEAKNTVGLTFDSNNGDWSELLKNVSEAVMKSLMEVEREKLIKQKRRL